MAYQQRIVTSHGTLALEVRGEGKTPVLLIPGNSSCRDVFHYQLEEPFAASYRMIAFDLPGHCQFSDAPDPQRSYTLTASSDKDAQPFIHSVFGESAKSFLFEAAMRADGRSRKRLFESAREGEGVIQRETVESLTIPIAVINGAADHLIKLDYFETVSFQNLWAA
jgi:hypothetical protein